MQRLRDIWQRHVQARVPFFTRTQQGTSFPPAPPPQPRLQISIQEVEAQLELRKVVYVKKQSPQLKSETPPLSGSLTKQRQQAVAAQAKQLGLSPEQLRAKLEGLLLLLPDVSESTLLSMGAEDLQDLMADTSAVTSAVATRLVQATIGLPIRIPGGGPLQAEDAARFLWQHPQLLSSRHWDNLPSSLPVASFQGHTWGVSAVAITPDGRHAVSGSWDCTLRVWDLQARTCVGTLQGHTDWVLTVAISPDGRHVVSASNFDDPSLRVWDLKSQTCAATAHGRPWCSPVAITPDGRHVVADAYDGVLRVLDLQSLVCVAKLGACAWKPRTGPVYSMAISPDGRHALAGSSKNSNSAVYVWDLQKRKHTARLLGHDTEVAAVAISPDCRHAVSGSRDRTLRVWDLQARRCVKILRGHTEAVIAVAITPDGRHAVSGSEDCTLRVWDLQALGCVATLWGHTDKVMCVAVSPDGLQAVSGSGDHMLLVWDLQPHTGGCRTIPPAP